MLAGPWVGLTLPSAHQCSGGESSEVSLGAPGLPGRYQNTASGDSVYLHYEGT